MRMILITAALLFSSGSTGWSQIVDSTTADATEHRDVQLSESSKIDAAIRASLNQPMDFQFDETPWREVEESLETKLKVNIVLTSSARDDSLSEDEPITCSFQGLNAKTALRLILVSKNATLIVQDNVIKIISLDDDDVPRFYSTHFINVRALLASIAELEKGRIGKPRFVRENPADANQPGAAPATPDAAGEVTAESLLIDLLQASVSPDRWKESGNGDATMKIVGGYLVVNCPDSLADALANFLQDLTYHLSSK